MTRVNTTGSALLRMTAPLVLVLPLFLFLLSVFFAPIAITLWQSVWDPQVVRALPRTVEALRDQSANPVPDDAVFSALATDFRDPALASEIPRAATRLNSDSAGMRSLIVKTSREARKPDAKLGTAAEFSALDDRWGTPETWRTIRAAASPLTDTSILAALDLKRNETGSIVAVEKGDALFLSMLARTMTMAVSVTLICLVIGFPFAYFIASSPPGRAAVLMLFVLLPLWSSILVRTLSWTVLLQREGVVNAFLGSLHIAGAPFDLMFNRATVYIGMTHILLPFMVLALYGSMKSIAPQYLRAAQSLGAKPHTVFRRVYLPLVMPGVLSGCLLVFIQALGAYITPLLLGGPNDQTIAPIIASYVIKSANIPLAAALSLLLLVAIVVLSLVYRAIAGPNRQGLYA